MNEVKRITVGPIVFLGGELENYLVRSRQVVTIIMESGGYTTPDGFYHPDGIYKVSSRYTLSRKVHKRAKTFKGETAWMKAENEYSDRVYQVQYKREGDHS